MFITAFTLIRLLDAAGSGAGSGGGSGASSTPTAVQAPASTAVSTPAGQSQGASSTSSEGSQSQQGQQQGQTQTQPDPSDPAYGNWKALRDTLQNERTRAAGLETQLQTFTQLRTGAQTLAKTLGYDDADFTEAFNADPAGTILILRQEEAAARQSGQRGGQQQGQQGNQQDLQDQIRDLVRKETAPVTAQVNQQITEAAMVKYEQNLTTAITADPVLKNAPPEVHDIVKDYLGEYFASQPQVLLAMKTKGDFSAIPEAVKYISGRLNTAFAKWLAHNNAGGRPSQTSPALQRPNGGAKITLDDIINDPAVLGAQYK